MTSGRLHTISENEILPSPEVIDRQSSELAKKLLDEVKGSNGKVVYLETSCKVSNDTVFFDFASVKSKDLARLLQDCSSAVIFVATIGHEFDRLLNKYSKISPASAYLLQRAGLIMIENCCDKFMEHVKSESGCELTERFSPGYGDLDLSFQNTIFNALSVEKLAGVTLTSSLLMSPSKSISAIFGKNGIKGCNQNKKCVAIDCDSCIKKDICKANEL